MRPEQPHIYVTIPVRAESTELPSNLRSLTEQEGVDSQDYSVVYLISNTKDETRTDSLIYKDNTQSLNLLRNFQRTNPRLALKILNLTDINNAPDIDSVGLARKRLVEEVMEIHDTNVGNAIIATLDADTLVDKDYIHKLRSVFGHPKVSAVVGTINYRNTGDIPYAEYLYFRIFDVAYALLQTEPQVSAQSFAFRLSAYQRVGGFKTLAGGEDIDLGRRLIEAGGVVFTDEIVTYPKLRYSNRCAGNGQLLLDLHESLARGEKVNYLLDGETLSTEELVEKALKGIDFSADELSIMIEDIQQRIKKPLLSFQEIDLLLKYTMLRMGERKFQRHNNFK